MAPVARRRGGGRHVLYAHLAGLGGGLGRALRLVATTREAARCIKTALLRLVHLLLHKASEHCPQHPGQHKPYKYKKQQQRKREAHELFEKKGNLRRAGG